MNLRLPAYSCVVLGLALWTGCLGEAPRGNPLDPMSEGFQPVGNVVGRVTGFYAPFPGLAGAEVRLTPGPYVAQTDADGQFVIEAVPEGIYEVAAVKDGYEVGLDTVAVAVGQARRKELRLSGLPVVADLTLLTTHISRWWPPPLDLYALTVTADIVDLDGLADIDSVWVEIPALGFAAPLPATQVSGRFQRNLSEAELPAATLFGVQGLGIRVHTLDRAGSRSSSPPQSLSRILDVVPVAGEPQAGISINDPQPTLTWQPVRLPFGFSYRVAVSRADFGAETEVWALGGIDASATSVQVGVALTAGATYNWTLDVVDGFGNWTRSKPAGFIVVQ